MFIKLIMENGQLAEAWFTTRFFFQQRFLKERLIFTFRVYQSIDV